MFLEETAAQVDSPFYFCIHPPYSMLLCILLVLNIILQLFIEALNFVCVLVNILALTRELYLSSRIVDTMKSIRLSSSDLRRS